MTVDLPFARHAVRDLVAHRRKVYCLDWSCNGKKLATGSNDQTVRVWNIDAKHRVSLLPGDSSFAYGHVEVPYARHSACMHSGGRTNLVAAPPVQ